MASNTSKWMSVNEAARRLNVPAAVVRYQIIQGQIRSRLTENGREVTFGTAAEKARPRRAWWKLTTATGAALVAVGAAVVMMHV